MDNVHLELIKWYYGARKAKRSGVLYMNHITEGLKALEYLDAGTSAKDAWCLHPMFQSDADFPAAFITIEYFTEETGRTISAEAASLATEYRNVANKFLSNDMLGGVSSPPEVLMLDIHDMLVVDKVQNKKDFMRYHKGTHPNSRLLENYFNIWLHHLKINNTDYLDLCEVMDN